MEYSGNVKENGVGQAGTGLKQKQKRKGVNLSFFV
jgi:hypothetical protein